MYYVPWVLVNTLDWWGSGDNSVQQCRVSTGVNRLTANPAWVDEHSRRVKPVTSLVRQCAAMACGPWERPHTYRSNRRHLIMVLVSKQDKYRISVPGLFYDAPGFFSHHPTHFLFFLYFMINAHVSSNMSSQTPTFCSGAFTNTTYRTSFQIIHFIWKII